MRLFLLLTKQRLRAPGFALIEGSSGHCSVKATMECLMGRRDGAGRFLFYFIFFFNRCLLYRTDRRQADSVFFSSLFNTFSTYHTGYVQIHIISFADANKTYISVPALYGPVWPYVALCGPVWT